jgi:hypothetical protein
MGPPVEGPHGSPVAPPRSCQWVNASRHNSICPRILRKLPDDELPCLSLARCSLVLRVLQHLRIRQSYSIYWSACAATELCFRIGFEPPRWTFGSLLVARLGWLFRDIQGRATPAAGAPGADTSLTVSASVACLVLVVICTDRVTPS